MYLPIHLCFFPLWFVCVPNVTSKRWLLIDSRCGQMAQNRFERRGSFFLSSVLFLHFNFNSFCGRICVTVFAIWECCACVKLRAKKKVFCVWARSSCNRTISSIELRRMPETRRSIYARVSAQPASCHIRNEMRLANCVRVCAWASCAVFISNKG